MLLAKTFITTPLYSYFFKMHDCMASMTGDMVTIAYFIVVVSSKLISDGTNYLNIIRNCWISVRGAIKMHRFSTSTERSKACVPKGCNFIAPQALNHYPAIRTLFYCLTIEQFFIQVLSEVRHTC